MFENVAGRQCCQQKLVDECINHGAVSGVLP